MTFVAAPGDGKSRFPLVARAARFTLLHLLHRITDTL